VVITGAGAAFSLGREPLPRELYAGPAAQRHAWFEQLRVADALAALPVPVVISVNGDVLDHGLELALAGDMRISATGCRFGLTDLSRPGCFPWDGGTQRLPRLVGPAWASELILTSRIINSAEALNIGLVNRVVPAGELARETQRLAEAIAAGGPIAARYAREAVSAGSELGLAAGLRLEADLNLLLQSTDDRAEGLRSFAEKRSPRFPGR
jgi:enoyl-CoA hydratase/carnithine racemase